MRTSIVYFLFFVISLLISVYTENETKIEAAPDIIVSEKQVEL